MEPIKHIDVRKGMKVSELVGEMKNAGFGAQKIGRASEIMRKMFNDKKCTVFLGLAGAMVPAGMKKVVMDLLEETDVFVVTGANLTHDLIEAIGESHYHGEESGDDSKLNEMGIDRIYNVFMKNSVYEKLEDFFEKNFEEMRKCHTIKELLWKIGEILSKSSLHQSPDHPPLNSILKKCYEKKIPIFCPAIADSGIGLMIWGRNVKGKEGIKVDTFEDMKEIIDIAWSSEKRGVIYVGGGVPKNFIQQSLQFSKGADYGIQISTDRQEPGGSSGAPLKEGISWGKMAKTGEFIDVFCDATIALPLIYAAVKE